MAKYCFDSIITQRPEKMGYFDIGYQKRDVYDEWMVNIHHGWDVCYEWMVTVTFTMAGM